MSHNCTIESKLWLNSHITLLTLRDIEIFGRKTQSRTLSFTVTVIYDNRPYMQNKKL